MNLDQVSRVYFLGIGGIGMSALARYFKKQGANVSGYDKTPSTLTAQLQSEDIQVHFNQDESNLDLKADLFVYTPAIPKSHPFFKSVMANGKVWNKRSEVLQLITQQAKTIAISGTHGKTTTSAFLTHILNEVHGRISGFVGGVMSNYNSNLIASADSEYIIVEADEYDKSFLKLKPEVALITSLDPDHLDIYGSFEQMKTDYQTFASLANTLIVNNRLSQDFGNAISTYSAEKETKRGYEAINIQVKNARFQFNVQYNGQPIGSFHTQLPGRHNVENATAAISIAYLLGLDMKKVEAAVGSFKGVHRRFDRVLESKNVRLIDDYAHHPIEIEATIKAARELYPNTKITVAFQPHLFTRTRDLEDGFIASLNLADEVILTPIYPAREEPIDGVTSANLLKKLSLKTKLLVENSHLSKAVLSLSPETVLVLGAGDIDRSVKPLAKALSNWIPMWNRVLHISSWVLGIALLFVLLGASVTSSNKAMLSDVKISIDYGEGNFFIDQTEISEVVSDLGYSIDSTPIIDVKPRRIEHVLENNAFIQSAEVYEHLNGVLHVDVQVRQPIVRIYSQNGQSIYLDEDGKFMPLSRSYAARTPITNGYISINLKALVGESIDQIADSVDHPDLAVIRDLYEIVTTCRSDPFWKAQFNQFYVNANREIEIIPRVGDHVILVGNATEIDKKLKKLSLFYDKGLNKTGWNEYKTINLKYANQVVCSKS